MNNSTQYNIIGYNKIHLLHFVDVSALAFFRTMVTIVMNGTKHTHFRITQEHRSTHILQT